MHAIVVANGALENTAALRARLEDADEHRVIAADGGALNAEALGLTPDAIVGDLDSLDPKAREHLREAGVKLVQSPPEKDHTDIELALRYAEDLGVETVIVLGALGSRLDMTLANLLLLADPRYGGLNIEVWHGDQTALLLRPPGGEIPGAPGDTLSLIPVDGPAEGIVTEGLKYALDDEPLALGPARGVSNVFTGPVARVELSDGALLAVHTPGRPA